MRGQPAPLSPLTEEQRRFAEQHHGLVYAFLRETGHSAADYYDAAALGFLQAVQRYLTQPWLRRYAFSTIAWQAMARSVAADYRAEERRRNAERRYLETVRARPPDPRRDLEEQFVLHDLISIGNEDQRRLIQLRLQGYTVAEAAQAQGMSGKRARKLLNGLHRVYSDTERGLNIHEY